MAQAIQFAFRVVAPHVSAEHVEHCVFHVVARQTLRVVRRLCRASQRGRRATQQFLYYLALFAEAEMDLPADPAGDLMKLILHGIARRK
jgi:hypothetical protein